MNKAKQKEPLNEMALPIYLSLPLEVVNLNFAELKMKSEEVAWTQAFMIAIDECTRMVASRAEKEYATNAIIMLERDMFKNTTEDKKFT